MGEQSAKRKGAVKWFNATKGFGFITPAEGGEDLFVHQTSINAEGFRSLREGEDVEYDVEAGPDGRTKAISVTGPEGAAPQGAPRRPRSRSTAAAAEGEEGEVVEGEEAAPASGRGGRGARGAGRGAGRGGFGAYAGYGGAYGGYGYFYPGGRGRGRGRGRGGMFMGRGGRALQGPPPGQPGESSGLQVVVHNLPWSCTWQQLKDAFKEFKVERADVVYDSWGRSRGFGTVRFSTSEEAEAACEKLNNTEIDGRAVTVRIDRFA